MSTRTSIFATNDNVTAADLNALAGASNTYTPTVGGGWTKGNGTVAGKYLQFGKLIAFEAVFTYGSTSTYGGASLDLGLPVAAAARVWAVDVILSDISVNKYVGAYVLGAGVVALYATSTAGSLTPIGAIFTPAAGDTFTVCGWAEAA